MAKLGLLAKILAGGSVLAIAVGCHTDMWVQPKHRPLEASELFADGQSSRAPVKGTVARDHLREDEAFFTGKLNGKLIEGLPMNLSPTELQVLINRGGERFRIYCSPCHGRIGDGQGMISKRGLSLRRKPANYHTDRLRNMPIGHFYDVMTNGYGTMFSYASRVEPQDRWAIAAYIRTLQLSQHFDVSDSPGQRRRLRIQTKLDPPPPPSNNP